MRNSEKLQLLIKYFWLRKNILETENVLIKNVEIESVNQLKQCMEPCVSCFYIYSVYIMINSFFF